VINKERAFEIAFRESRDFDVANNVVEKLDKLGILARDLPKDSDTSIFVPNGKGWLPGGPHGPSIWTAPGGTVMVQRIEPGNLTPEEAREVADVLYAAAEYSENGETNESSE